MSGCGTAGMVGTPPRVHVLLPLAMVSQLGELRSQVKYSGAPNRRLVSQLLALRSSFLALPSQLNPSQQITQSSLLYQLAVRRST